jgi:pyruvate formate lyase activating enzyme
VLDTLAYVHHETSCWLEVTTLLIPGANDSDAEITALSQWMYRELGADVPLHFTAFHPDFKMTGLPATPPDSVVRARRIAMGEGLRYVYTGNVHDAEGGTTWCPRCNTALIGRDWHHITAYLLHHTHCCPKCDFPIAGRFDPVEGEFRQFGRRRIPVSFAPPGNP